MLAPESTTNSLSSGFIRGCGRKTPLIGSEKNVFLSFSLSLWIFLANLASFLSLSLFLRSVLKFHGVGTALMRTFDLYFMQRWTFAFSDVCLTQRSSCESLHVEIGPQNLCALPRNRFRFLAAQRPVIHNPTVAHFSQQLLHFCHHPSSGFCCVVPRPSSAEMSTLRRTYIPFQTKNTEIWQDSKESQCNLVQVPFKNFWHGCRLGFPDWLLPLRLLFLDAVLPLEDCGSEGGAAFGVAFSRS